jgi:hypothetical protein
MAAIPLLLAYEWVESFRAHTKDAGLIVVSISALWMASTFAWHSAIGPDRSTFRGIVIIANIFAVITAAIASVIPRSNRRFGVFFAGLGLGAGWLIALAVMDVV